MRSLGLPLGPAALSLYQLFRMPLSLIRSSDSIWIHQRGAFADGLARVERDDRGPIDDLDARAGRPGDRAVDRHAAERGRPRRGCLFAREPRLDVPGVVLAEDQGRGVELAVEEAEHVGRILRPGAHGRTVHIGLAADDLARDGVRSGYDLDLLRAVTNAVKVPVIASGGAGEARHMVEAVTEGGADAVLAASIFHFGDVSIGEVKAAMAEAGVAVRAAETAA
jgi:hypothetical protein